MADEVRLIDGNALKEDFMNDYHNYMMESLRGNHHDVIRISNVIERIEDAPTIEAEPDNGWISVKDRLPDECEEVLIYCPEFLEEIRKALYTDGDFYIEKEDLIVKPAPNGYCTHWQPLPNPPKGE